MPTIEQMRDEGRRSMLFTNWLDELNQAYDKNETTQRLKLLQEGKEQGFLGELESNPVLSKLLFGIYEEAMTAMTGTQREVTPENLEICEIIIEAAPLAITTDRLGQQEQRERLLKIKSNNVFSAIGEVFGSLTKECNLDALNTVVGTEINLDHMGMTTTRRWSLDSNGKIESSAVIFSDADTLKAHLERLQADLTDYVKSDSFQQLDEEVQNEITEKLELLKLRIYGVMPKESLEKDKKGRPVAPYDLIFRALEDGQNDVIEHYLDKANGYRLYPRHASTLLYDAIANSNMERVQRLLARDDANYWNRVDSDAVGAQGMVWPIHALLKASDLSPEQKKELLTRLLSGVPQKREAIRYARVGLAEALAAFLLAGEVELAQHMVEQIEESFREGKYEGRIAKEISGVVKNGISSALRRTEVGGDQHTAIETFAKVNGVLGEVRAEEKEEKPKKKGGRGLRLGGWFRGKKKPDNQDELDDDEKKKGGLLSQGGKEKQPDAAVILLDPTKEEMNEQELKTTAAKVVNGLQGVVTAQIAPLEEARVVAVRDSNGEQVFLAEPANDTVILVPNEEELPTAVNNDETLTTADGNNVEHYELPEFVNITEDEIIEAALDERFAALNEGMEEILGNPEDAQEVDAPIRTPSMDSNEREPGLLL